MIGADAIGPEPHRLVLAGQHVALDAEGRDEEVVDDVLRRHDQFDRRVDRDVQGVDLALAAGVLDLPHPLLGDDIDLQRVGRWLVTAGRR